MRLIRQVVVTLIASVIGLVSLQLHAVSSGVAALSIDQLSGKKYGWGFGASRHPRRLEATFTGNGTDLFLHAQGWDIEGAADVLIHVNGQRLGALHPGKSKAYSNGALWYVPAAMQRKGENLITFSHVAGDNRWGVRNLGMIRPSGRAASFGYMRTTGGDLTHPRAVRVYLPSAEGGRRVRATFFDVDRPGEVMVKTSHGVSAEAGVTSADDFGASAFYDVPASQSWIEFRNSNAGNRVHNWGVRIGAIDRAFDPTRLAGLQPVSNAAWDQAAVRRVLHTFAFGGHATEAQIRAWSVMAPHVAIVEMLNFKQHNNKLSPPDRFDDDRLHAEYGRLAHLRGVMRRSPNLPNKERWIFQEEWPTGQAWALLTSARGMNPFLHRIAQWETNYHMAVNHAAGVSGDQIVRYYDEILTQLERDAPYETVMSTAALSAAVAMQYKHNDSRWLAAENFCECNEDFAREYYQLFFGVLGTYNPTHHETVTIKNMAKALTDIQVKWRANLRGYPTVPTYGNRYHFQGNLQLWPGYTSFGQADPRSRIAAISREAIRMPESLDNLPVKIISGLADDNLDFAKISAIRAAWKSMETKSLLDFIRGYAISTQFHSESRVKYWNSLERRMFLNTGIRLTNKELWFNTEFATSYESEGYYVFSPKHNVFGGQRGTEAARSPEIFRSTYNRATDTYWEYARFATQNSGLRWTKNWARALPRDSTGQHRVSQVAEWLWNRVIGDGLSNFGPTERAFVYAFLGDQFDLLQRLSPNDLNRVIARNDVLFDVRVRNLVNDLGNRTMLLSSTNSEFRNEAMHRVGKAIAFISATPYAFAQQGL